MSDFTIIRNLNPAGTRLARDAVGRDVVLKAIHADCLLGDGLHPGIADRLARVRELAHLGVANLYAIQNDGGQIVAVWQYLPGETLEEYAGRIDSREKLAAVEREIALSVQALHGLGIVHGRLHERNIIVDERGTVFLTHVSPLLYYDAAADRADLAKMFARLSQSRGWKPIEIGKSAAAIRHSRVATLIGAAAVVVAAVALAVGIVWLTGRNSPGNHAPPRAPIEAMSP
jgi:serine/threonine protein kinase